MHEESSYIIQAFHCMYYVHICGTCHMLGWWALWTVLQCELVPEFAWIVSPLPLSYWCPAEPAPGSTTKQILPRKRQKPVH